MAEYKKIMFPPYRYDIFSSLRELANFKMQNEKWPKNTKEHPHSYWDSLTFYIFGVLYDERNLDEYKESNIGEIFYNEEEAKKIWEFCYWFNEITDNIGGYKPDSEYLEHPEWHRVYSGARECYELMDENDKKYNFSKCFQEFNEMDREKWYAQFEDNK